MKARELARVGILYIQRRWRALAAGLCAVFICAGVFMLYNLPPAAVWYAAVLSLLPAGLFLFFDLRDFRMRLGTLEALISDPTDVPQHLPRTGDPLEARYQTLCRALCRACSTAQERAEERCADRMAYYTMWAHQIKTPIAAMRLLLQSEETDVRALSGELFRIEEYVGMAMCYLHLEERDSDYVIGEVPLDALIRQTVHRYAPMFIRREIRFSYEGTAARVLTDEKWLSFLLGQLLSNALKYTRPGGRVEIAVTDGPVLCVRDTGIGIPASELPRVFERGYTGTAGRTDKHASGIGLYLCRRIADNLGHGIAISSEPGRGTEVRVSLARRELPLE